jgi:hypothetical protein
MISIILFTVRLSCFKGAAANKISCKKINSTGGENFDRSLIVISQGYLTCLNNVAICSAGVWPVIAC